MLTSVRVSSRQPDREVDVGARVVHAPVAAVAAEVAAEPRRGRSGSAPSKSLSVGDIARADVAEAADPAALAELRVHAHRQHQGYQPRQEQDNVPPPSHEASLPSKWKSGNVEK